MIHNVLGTPESSSEDAIGGTISQFLDKGGSILKDLLSKGAQAVSQQALSSFANILSFGIQQALDNMEDTPACRQPKEKLNEIIATLDSVRDNGNWSDLYHNLVKASEALKPVKIYINGFRVPRIGSESVKNAEGIYSDHISALQKAIDSSSPEQENQDWITLAENEKNKLIDNATKYLTIKHIYE